MQVKQCFFFINFRILFFFFFFWVALLFFNFSLNVYSALSRWCITHRKKAKLIVETWDKIFKSAPREQLVSFLYLANDILQNSRRKGSEFVNEFWKFLPAALKNVYANGDDSGKKAASRLVEIWEQRKVFGSRGQNLKDDILGRNHPLPPNPPAPTVSNGKTSNPIKVVKRDTQFLRIKLAVGDLPEKIISAFQSMYDEIVNEEVALNKCRTAISQAKVLENDIESSSSQGNLVDSDLAEKIQEQENTLRYCVSLLENAAATRLALALQLKEALQDQESKLEIIQHELQVAHGQLEQAVCAKQKLSSHSVSQAPAVNPLFEGAKAAEASLCATMSSNTPLIAVHPSPSLPSTMSTNAPPIPPVLPPAFSSKLNEEDSKKAMAAAVAAKLTASTSSAQMLTSVLSSLAAEEVAYGLNSTRSSSSLPFFGSPEKRLKLDEHVSGSDVEHYEENHSTFFASMQQNVNIVPVAPSNGIQHVSQGIPIPPFAHQQAPPSIPPASSAASQIGQSAAMMAGVMPYGYATGNLPLPPPPPSHLQLGFARPASAQNLQAPPQQLPNQQSQPQQGASGGYYRPPGIGFYGQTQQPAAPPLPRQ
ncbi:OLC1v1036197C1 [Oldenlandia corymbosa var. corymbosa]|uniref:OLC1v1036197C1 n=1 Tax=Oldenlandia corymbosa var. corymbosa TaxID=529605 RepID=A0AAV1CXB3_OLDCO|nr:OLC1v1036197C1 [Oldenlandia corymbosa var. corymbosa]